MESHRAVVARSGLLLVVVGLLVAAWPGCGGGGGGGGSAPLSQQPPPTPPPPPPGTPPPPPPPPPPPLPPGTIGGTVPAGIPSTFSLGLANDPAAGLSWLKASGVPFDFRYQYLAAGANTGSGWSTWNAPPGQFATIYCQDSAATSTIPVFTYYMLLQSNPHNGPDESTQDLSNLTNAATMNAYYADWKLLMQKCAGSGKTVVVHVEPDLWGYIEQKVDGAANSAAGVPASVASSGFADCATLPDTAQGFALALLHMRDLYAPNVRLAIHLSRWGNLANWSSPNAGLNVASLAARSAAFLLTCGVTGNPGGIKPWDMFFVDHLDRDADYKRLVSGDPNQWYTAADFANFRSYLAQVSQKVGLRFFLWQLPVGNYYFRSCNNTDGHYQDPTPQYFLENYPTNTAIADWAGAGCLGLLFGRGAGGPTTYTDDKGDGVTNPASIPANNLGNNATLSDDDGGYLRLRSNNYYQKGRVTLP